MISDLCLRATCKQGHLIISESRVMLKGSAPWELARAAVAGVLCDAGLLTADLTVVARDGQHLPLTGVSFREALAIIELLGYLAPQCPTDSAAGHGGRQVEIAGNYIGSKLTITANEVTLIGQPGWTIARNAIVAVRCVPGAATAALHIRTRNGQRVRVDHLPFNGALHALELLEPPAASDELDADAGAEMDTVETARDEVPRLDPAPVPTTEPQPVPAPPPVAPASDPPSEPITPPAPVREPQPAPAPIREPSPEPNPAREPAMRFASSRAAAPAKTRPYTEPDTLSRVLNQRPRRKPPAHAIPHTSGRGAQGGYRLPLRGSAAAVATPPAPTSPVEHAEPDAEGSAAPDDSGSLAVEADSRRKPKLSAAGRIKVDAFRASILNAPDPCPAATAPAESTPPVRPAEAVTAEAPLAVSVALTEPDAPTQPRLRLVSEDVAARALAQTEAAPPEVIRSRESLRGMLAKGRKLVALSETAAVAARAAGLALLRAARSAGKRALLGLLALPLIFAFVGAATHFPASGQRPAPHAARPLSRSVARVTPAATPAAPLERKVFVGSHDGSIYALAASDGHLVWRYGTDAPVESSPTYAAGVIYFGSDDHYIYALRATDHQVLWRYMTGAKVSAPPAVANGVVYAGSDDDYLYALRASDGALLWRFKTGDWIESRPAVANGIVVVGSDDHRIVALRASDGALLWWYRTYGAVSSSPTIANGIIYVGSADHGLYALRLANGTLLWRYMTGGSLVASPAVVAGVVYVGSFDHSIYALRAGDGAVLWRYTTGSSVLSTPGVVNGVVYIGSDDGSVYALGASNGKLLWRYATNSPIASWPAATDGTVYIGSTNHTVYALDSHSGQRLWSYMTGSSVGWLPAVGS